MRPRNLIAAVCVMVILAACGRGQSKPAESKADGAAQMQPISALNFSENAELFVEFEPLRVGKDSLFAAHLTRLGDFKPVTEGRLVVTLSGGGAEPEHFEAPNPASPGIFKPVAHPAHAGKRTLTISLVAPSLESTHVVGEVTVYESDAAAEKASPPKQERSGEIAFLMEQQWQVDFATQPVAKARVQESIPATATIRGASNGMAQIVAPVAGQLVAGTTGFPRIGMVVKKGDALASMLPRLGAEVDMATLRLDGERAQLKAEHARAEVGRLQTLFDLEAVPGRRLTEAQHEARVADAELQAAERRLDPYGRGADARNGVVLRAPLAGSVAEVQAQPGTALNAGDPVLVVANMNTLWLEARIPEADIPRMSSPSGAWVRAPGMDSPIELAVGRNTRMVSFGGLLDPQTRTAPLVMEFTNPGTELRIGTAVQADVWTGRSTEGIAVPLSAVLDDNGQDVVFVQRNGESFERRVVRVGRRAGDRVEIAAGLTEGERIVVRGTYLVKLAGTSPASAGEGHVH